MFRALIVSLGHLWYKGESDRGHTNKSQKNDKIDESRPQTSVELRMKKESRDLADSSGSFLAYSLSKS